MKSKIRSLINKHEYYNYHFFTKWAWLYDLEKYLTFLFKYQAAKFMGIRPPAKIIDVATGTGSQAYELAKLGFEVTGIDLSPEMLEQAKKKCTSGLKLSFQQADATELPFENQFFDASSITLGLHDMPYEIDILVLQEMKRVTKSGGSILIVDYMEPKKHIVARFSHPLISLYETYNYAPFIKRGLDKILKDVGLKVYRATNFLGIIQINLVINI